MEKSEKASAESPAERSPAPQEQTSEGIYSADTEISEVTADPDFGDFGRLIFPVDSWYYSGSTLGDLSLTWYNNIDPNKTVEIVNYLKDHALEAMEELGVPTEFHAYEGLRHGFGLGTGTVAEGWINDAVAFWEAQTAASSGKEDAGLSVGKQ